MMKSTSQAKTRRRPRGQSVAEFALILPVIVLIVMILFDFGHVVYTQYTLDGAAREASRVGSLSVGGLEDAEWVDRYAAIRNAALGNWVGRGDVTLTASSIAGLASPGCASLPPDPVTPGVCFYPDGYSSAGLNPGRVYVEITVQVPLLTPGISSLFGSEFTVVAKSVTQVHS